MRDRGVEDEPLDRRAEVGVAIAGEQLERLDEQRRRARSVSASSRGRAQLARPTRAPAPPARRARASRSAVGLAFLPRVRGSSGACAPAARSGRRRGRPRSARSAARRGRGTPPASRPATSVIGVEPWRSNHVVSVSPAATCRASTISKARCPSAIGGACLAEHRQVVGHEAVGGEHLPVELLLQAIMRAWSSTSRSRSASRWSRSVGAVEVVEERRPLGGGAIERRGRGSGSRCAGSGRSLTFVALNA